LRQNLLNLKWFSFLKIKLNLARFWKNSEIKLTWTQIVLGWPCAVALLYLSQWHKEPLLIPLKTFKQKQSRFWRKENSPWTKKTKESKRKETTPKSPLEEAKADLVRDGFMGAVSLVLSWQFSFFHVLRNTLSCFHDKFFYPCTKKHTYHAFMTNSFFHVLRNMMMRNYAKCIHSIERRRKKYQEKRKKAQDVPNHMIWLVFHE